MQPTELWLCFRFGLFALRVLRPHCGSLMQHPVVPRRAPVNPTPFFLILTIPGGMFPSQTHETQPVFRNKLPLLIGILFLEFFTLQKSMVFPANVTPFAFGRFI